MTQLIESNRISPGAEIQILEDRAGNRELRLRSGGNKPMTIKTQSQLVEIIAVAAAEGPSLETE